MVCPDRLPSFTAKESALAREETHALAAGVAETLRLLAKAKRPLFLAGHSIRLSGAAKSFLKLIEIPVLTTWNAMDLLPSDRRMNVGKPGVVALRAPNFAIQNCDLLILVGCRLDNVITAYNPRGFARAADKVIPSRT